MLGAPHGEVAQDEEALVGRAGGVGRRSAAAPAPSRRSRPAPRPGRPGSGYCRAGCRWARRRPRPRDGSRPGPRGGQGRGARARRRRRGRRADRPGPRSTRRFRAAPGRARSTRHTRASGSRAVTASATSRSPSEQTSTSKGGGSTWASMLARQASSSARRRPVTMQTDTRGGADMSGPSCPTGWARAPARGSNVLGQRQGGGDTVSKMAMARRGTGVVREPASPRPATRSRLRPPARWSPTRSPAAPSGSSAASTGWCGRSRPARPAACSTPPASRRVTSGPWSPSGA